MTDNLSFKISPPTGSLRSAVGRRSLPNRKTFAALPGRAHRSLRRGLGFPGTTPASQEMQKDTTNFTSRNVVIGNGRPPSSTCPHRSVCTPDHSDPPFQRRAPADLPASRRDRSTARPMIRELCSKCWTPWPVRTSEREHPVRAVHPAERHPRHVGLSRRGHRAIPRIRPHHPRGYRSPGRGAHHRVRAVEKYLSPRSKSTWTARAMTSRRIS